MVNNSNSGKDFEIPVDIMEKWQRMVNIMSKLLRVPAGFIMKVKAPNIQIFTANVADTNPYNAGQNFELTGLYCEEVMKSDNLLCVPDALKDPEWDNNPEIPAGFIYYLGYPIHWPTGKMFGTICVQDYKNNPHATNNKDLLVEFRSVCEHDLLMAHMRMNLESIVAERTVDLRISEERFRMTFEQAAVGIAHVALDGFFLRINQRFCDIVGYSSEEMLTRTFQDITHPDDLDVDLEYVRQVLADEIMTYSMEKRYFKKGGEVVWINLTVSLLRDDNGKPQYFIAVVEDISERKEAEEALLESESKLREAQKIAKIGIWEWDLVADKGIFAEETYKIYDLDPDARIIYESMMEVIHPEDRERHEDLTKKLLENVSSDPYDYRVIHKDGTIRHLYTQGRVEYDEDGNPVKLSGIVQDITEHKLAEQALKEDAEFQKLVSKISTLFINIPVDEIDQTIHNQFKEIGEFFNADRVTIGQLSEKGEVLAATHMWFSDKVNAEKLAADMMGAIYPNFANHLKHQDYWSFSDPDDFSHWHPERETIDKTDFKSGIAIKLSFEDINTGNLRY